MSNKRVIVVGTTSDYISLLSRRYPDRLLFITDTAEREKWPDISLEQCLELVCDLTDFDTVLSDLTEYTNHQGLALSGIVSFDCESMALASHLAQAYSLPYPTQEAISNSRSKFTSKQLWQAAGVTCPSASLVRNISDVIGFLEKVKHAVVLKPLTGSGSELVFSCESKQDCLWAHRQLASHLAHHPNVRMYVPGNGSPEKVDCRKVYAVEEMIQGREYSCDFILEEDRFDIIRIAQKIHAPDRPVGIIMAYVLPGILPGEMDYEAFRRQLHQAALALGLKRTLGMVDFIVRRNEAYLLEMTPRPGGDCIPELMYRSSGFDILGAALDFAEGKPIKLPAGEHWKRMVGLRLFADREGVIKGIDDAAIRKDGRVLMSQLKVGPGHEVILPPDNYDSQLLGTVIFKPTRAFNIKTECLEIAGLLKLEMETPKWAISNIS